MLNIGAHLQRIMPLVLTYCLGIASAMYVSSRLSFGWLLGGLPNVDATSWVTMVEALADERTVYIAMVAIGAAAVMQIGVLMRRQGPEQEAHQAQEPQPTCEPEAKPAPSDAHERIVASVGKELDQQLTEIVRFVSVYLESSLGHSRRMAGVQSLLSQADSLDQVRLAVQMLVALNADTSRDAEELRHSLQDAKKQSEALREKLVSAEELAWTDPLTAIANRRRFDQILRQEVSQSHLEKTPLSLVLADLDHFKKINDRHGHQTGDLVLKTFAALLSNNVRANDLVARFGGEEFAIVLPNTPAGNATFLAERIQRAMSATYWRSADSKTEVGAITASFGIAEISEEETCENLVARTDRLLYAAKENGRNRVETGSLATPRSTTSGAAGGQGGKGNPRARGAATKKS